MLGAMTVQHHVDIERIVTSLAQRYSDTVTPAEVRSAVHAARAQLEPASRHPEFLGILIERRARDQLAKTAKAHGQRLQPVPTILFVSEHNSSRSQIAAAFAEHLGGEHVHVRAAGAHEIGFVNPLVERAMAELGVRADHIVGAGEAHHLADSADVIVEMGAHLVNVPGRTHLQWQVDDPHGKDIDVVRAVRDALHGRVRDLLADLGVPVTS